MPLESPGTWPRTLDNSSAASMLKPEWVTFISSFVPYSLPLFLFPSNFPLFSLSPWPLLKNHYCVIILEDMILIYTNFHVKWKTESFCRPSDFLNFFLTMRICTSECSLPFQSGKLFFNLRFWTGKWNYRF